MHVFGLLTEWMENKKKYLKIFSKVIIASLYLFQYTWDWQGLLPFDKGKLFGLVQTSRNMLCLNETVVALCWGILEQISVPDTPGHLHDLADFILQQAGDVLMEPKSLYLYVSWQIFLRLLSQIFTFICSVQMSNSMVYLLKVFIKARTFHLFSLWCLR